MSVVFTILDFICQHWKWKEEEEAEKKNEALFLTPRPLPPEYSVLYNFHTKNVHYFHDTLLKNVQRESDRQTERHRERETERETDRQTENEWMVHWTKPSAHVKEGGGW